MLEKVNYRLKQIISIKIIERGKNEFNFRIEHKNKN